MDQKLKIGIMGGMGPQATLYLFSQIVQHTLAERDQDHIRILVDNNPSIPDRSAFILGKGPDPVPAMREAALGLERMGADFLLIPCNTAHYFLDRFSRDIHIPILHMIESAARFLASRDLRPARVGLLSTLGTYRTGIYPLVFQQAGIEVLVPEATQQETIMETIYGKRGIKAGYVEENLETLVVEGQRLADAGAELILSGCTEISLVLQGRKLPFSNLCPMQVLAREAVIRAGYSLKEP